MSIERIKSALARGGAHLGDLVFWTLADARVDRMTLESLWAGAKLDAAHLPDSPTAEKALKLAVREAGVGHSDRLLRLAREAPDEIVFAVVREERPGDGTLDYHTEARITLDRQREVVHSDQPGHDVVVSVREKFDLYRNTHHPDDLRRALVRTLHGFAAVTLREGGGVYWVPAVFAGKVRQLRQAIEQIGSSRMYLLPVHQSQEASQTLGELARSSIEDELAGLRQEIEQFLSTPPERASTLTRRLDAFGSLRDRTRLYRSALAVEVNDLDQQLDRLSITVEQLLQQKAAA